MFRKRKDKDLKAEKRKKLELVAKNSVPSLISDDMNILGNLISDGYIDINGQVEGNVKCMALTVRDGGLIKGDVVAEMVTVQGEICGLIKAKHVHLHKDCRVRGVIMHESLTIEDGAFIDGQCKRTERHPDIPQGRSDRPIPAEGDSDGPNGPEGAENLKLIKNANA